MCLSKHIPGVPSARPQQFFAMEATTSKQAGARRNASPCGAIATHPWPAISACSLETEMQWLPQPDMTVQNSSEVVVTHDPSCSSSPMDASSSSCKQPAGHGGHIKPQALLASVTWLHDGASGQSSQLNSTLPEEAQVATVVAANTPTAASGASLSFGSIAPPVQPAITATCLETEPRWVLQPGSIDTCNSEVLVAPAPSCSWSPMDASSSSGQPAVDTGTTTQQAPANSGCWQLVLPEDSMATEESVHLPVGFDPVAAPVAVARPPPMFPWPAPYTPSQR